MQHGGVTWCNTRNRELLSMPAARRKTHKQKPSQSPRASVTFTPELYQTLEDLAKKKKVSVAWVVRDAAERYVADQWPLFARAQS
jgi:hypothetical protein